METATEAQSLAPEGEHDKNRDPSLQVLPLTAPGIPDISDDGGGGKSPQLRNSS